MLTDAHVPVKHLELRRKTILAGTEWNPGETGICFILLMEGKLAIKPSRDTRQVGKCDVVVVRQNSRSLLRAVDGEDAFVYFFQFEPGMLNGFLSAGEIHFLEIPSLLWHEPVSVHPAGSSLARCFLRFVESNSTPGTLTHTYKVLELIAALVPEKNGMEENSINLEKLDTTTKSRIVSIIEGLSETEFEDLSVEDIARKCGCSRRQLARVFQEQYGCTVTARKMGIRLDKATKMLVNSNLKVIEIAYQCGFSQLGQFSSKFKQRYGVTPALWRRNIVAGVAHTSAKLAMHHRNAKPKAA